MGGPEMADGGGGGGRPRNGYCHLYIVCRN